MPRGGRSRSKTHDGGGGAQPGSDPRLCHKGVGCHNPKCKFQHPAGHPSKRVAPPLGHLWQFPSDHVPVGGLLEDGLKLISWNVMDSRYINTCESMGLQDSMLTQQHHPTGIGKLTWRDATVLRTVLNLLSAPSRHPVAVLALQVTLTTSRYHPQKNSHITTHSMHPSPQECSADFLIVLDRKLAYGPYRRADNSEFGDAVLIYHMGLLKLTGKTMHEYNKSPFSGRLGGSGKPLIVATFERAGGPLAGAVGLIRVVAGKVPGNPDGTHLEVRVSMVLVWC